MPLTSALLLGAVQGLTEFIPISSTAHLYLVQALLGLRNDEVALSFDVVLHLGTVLALVLAIPREIAAMVRELLFWASGRPAHDPGARALLLPIAIGTVPGVLAGLLLLKKVESMRTVGLIGASMLVACVYFLAAEASARRRAGRERSLPEINGADALWIGVAQAAAGLMAGFSRSGFTISTARVRGISREDSARFSFLLALPIILGAGAKALLDLRRHSGPSVGGASLAAGFLASAVVGYFAVRFLLRYLKTHTLAPFAVYLGLLGAGLLVGSLWMGKPLFGG
ncbi:MAG TPA: undecaprenyl-diphosphate phosphatase [Thermoanaerobaculia bacterium]|nr:undecaprenyl-diphosphate phosphatase [Thermoanaerobaculia bacterium]